MRLCLKLINVLFFSLFFSWQAHSAQYEFGTFDTSTCSSFILSESAAAYEDGSGCVVRLKNTYATKPLVFLMPTIPSDNPDDDAPQTLALLNVTKKSFSVAQIVAPLSDSYSLSRNQMPVISYLVIEEGVTTFEDGHQVLAGSTNTKRYSADGRRSSPAYERINLSAYSWLISESPIILSEVQTRNNKRWLTTATKNISSTKFDLGLELTRVNIKDKDKIILKEKEKIGYLVSIPNIGETNGYDYEFSSGDIVSNSGKFKPLKYTCDTLINLRQTYTAPPNFIAGKLQRQGGQGGWVRQCKKSLTQVSFVVDEDIPPWTYIGQRAHIKEKVGFFAFAKKPLANNNICKYFLSPAQTWQGNSSPSLQIGKDSRLINTVEIKNKRYVGFRQESINNYLDKGCDDSPCNESQNLIVKKEDKPQLPSFKENKSNNEFDAGKQIEPEIPYSEYKNLYVRGGAITLNKDMKIETLSLDSNSQLTLNTGTYWIDSFIVNGSRIIVPKDNKVIIYTRGYSFNHSSGTNGSLINVDGSPDNLVIYAYNEPPTSTLLFKDFNAVSNSSVVKALIYSEKKTNLSNSAMVYGSITINQVALTNKSKIIGQSECFDSKPDNYILDIKPSTAFSLTCDYLPVTFSVNNEDGTLADTYSGSVSVSTNITTAGKASWFPINSETPYKDVSEVADVNIKNGVGQLRLKSHDYIGNIAVKGQLNNSPSTNTVNGSYTFVPFKFAISPSPIKVIAGKPRENIKVKALACENDQVTIATGYQGDKPLVMTSTFLQPTSRGNGDLQIKAINSDWQTSQETFSFDKGVSTFALKYSDAGIVGLTLADPNCSLSTGCDIFSTDDELPTEFGSWKQLEGSVEVYARPWTFAVCPKNQDGEYVKADGTSSSGEGFLAAGEKFNIDIKPIVWRSSGSETADINSRYSNSINLCESTITPNFSKSGAPAASVELSIPSDHSITPENGEPGELQGVKLKQHTEVLTYTRLSWNEVGSVRLQANTTAQYLGMNINQGYRNTGRFYPKYFALSNNQVTPAISHFTYLEQPFGAAFTINSYNSKGQKVKNYHRFSSPLKSEFELASGNNLDGKNYESLDERLKQYNGKNDLVDVTLPLWGENTISNESEIVFQPNNLVVQRLYLDVIQPNKSQPDGPFSNWQLRVKQTSTPDNVKWDDNEQVSEHGALVGDNDLRYGRMTLSDAISQFDQPVSLPLKIEYWDGSEFQTNTDDSGSTYNSNYYCKLALYPVDGSNTSILTTNITGNVSDGKSDEIEAHPQLSTPANYKKQQTRFWLRIANETPANIGCSQTNKEYQPWLTYNWRALGDEDPSAIVTFGVYRGSDRIVYRGEKGLN
ncbi:MSHA biogenesis protein MshQ [Photobacterium sp. SKA34]|uniref:DUF6701 domain-containing protein n=1 Tax=Photobacterium sp. SKA34 TaxID=121723 RepID=UPI00006ADD1A|nr:DUF6701 domain-containing protein [Photobacterium sp. SKA34]EAR54531.1 MSHA biogenesis protein MshQ [Photobacterium sp. SKA34]